MNDDDKKKKERYFFYAIFVVILIVGVIYSKSHPLQGDDRGVMEILFPGKAQNDTQAAGTVSGEKSANSGDSINGIGDTISAFQDEDIVSEFKKELGFNSDSTDDLEEKAIEITDDGHIIMEGRTYQLKGVEYTDIAKAVENMRSMCSKPVKVKTEGEEITLYIMGFSIQDILIGDGFAKEKE